jgi:hypothetical protein
MCLQDQWIESTVVMMHKEGLETVLRGVECRAGTTRMARRQRGKRFAARGRAKSDDGHANRGRPCAESGGMTCGKELESTQIEGQTMCRKGWNDVQKGGE